MQPRATARYTAALALALSFAPSLMRRSRREQLAVSAGSAVLGGAAGAATETVVVQLAGRVRGGEAGARLLLAGAGAGAALARLDRRGNAGALVGTGLRVAGVAALVGWVAPERRPRGFDPLPLAAAGAVAAGALAVRAERRRRGRRPIDFPVDAYLPSVSIGPASLVAALDFEGQRFCAGAVAGLPVDPVRVFVGVHSAEHVAARCDLAVAELERLGAFERSRLVVCAATLRGYVNPIPVATGERLSAGDVAHVVVQYHDRRTPWLWRKVPVAGQTHRELLDRLAARREATDGAFPELCVYGESLGAWASQRVHQDGGLEDLARRGVRRALWVGTPWLSRFARNVRPDERVAWLRTRDLREADPPAAERLRFVFLERLSDPVVLFPGLELLWRRPPWHGRWRPGISFLHAVVDLVKATRWTADEPASAAHDYRIEVPLAVNVAFGHLRPRAEVEAIAGTVLAEEAERNRRVRDARRAARARDTPESAVAAEAGDPAAPAPTRPSDTAPPPDRRWGSRLRRRVRRSRSRA